jgi:hypothetical protein
MLNFYIYNGCIRFDVSIVIDFDFGVVLGVCPFVKIGKHCTINALRKKLNFQILNK